MKILVAAKRVLPDRTSEGICSSKFIAALAGGAHSVSCVAGEAVDLSAGPAGFPDAVPVVHADVMTPRTLGARLSRAAGRLAAAGSAGRYLDRKANGVFSYATGHSLRMWGSVAQWREAIQAVAKRERPDVIITRGAGREFEPHLAMLGQPRRASWIAHYHDPYPGSLYPEPYRHRVPFLSGRQERLHRRFVAESDALTFPSARLRDWVLTGELARFRDKAFVVPHIASAPHRAAPALMPAVLTPECLNILHTGTLLRERDPRPLLRGLATFASRGGDRARVRLVMIGRVDRAHAAAPEWSALTRSGLLRVHTGRVDYGAAVALSRAAEALLVLEAAAPESPFFPAKLADYLWLGKPIVSLSPRQSVAADLLGADYPLLCGPGDAVAIADVFERLWTAWRSRTLAQLVPPAAVVGALSESTVRHRFDEIMAFLHLPRHQRVA